MPFRLPGGSRIVSLKAAEQNTARRWHEVIFYRVDGYFDLVYVKQSLVILIVLYVIPILFTAPYTFVCTGQGFSINSTMPQGQRRVNSIPIMPEPDRELGD